jgi:hypothetical protein
MGLSYYIPITEWYMHFEKDNIPAGQHKNWGCAVGCSGLMRLGASAMQAGFARFAADPEGLKPFMRYCEAYNIFNGFQYAFRQGLSLAGGWTGKSIRNEDGTTGNLPVNWKYFFDKWGDERTRLLELVKTKTPVKVIQEAATYYKDQVLKHETAKNYSELRYNYHVFENVMYLWREIKGGGGEFNSFFAEYKKLANRYTELVKMEFFNAPAIDFREKPINVDANLVAKATAAAKLFASNEDEPFTADAVVFFTKEWNEIKSQEWSNHPLSRWRKIGILSKGKDGRWMLHYALLDQKGNNRGGYLEEYSVRNLVLPINNWEKFPHAVNYKP